MAKRSETRVREHLSGVPQDVALEPVGWRARGMRWRMNDAKMRQNGLQDVGRRQERSPPRRRRGTCPLG